MNFTICSVITKNHIAQARVLAKSFKATHPSGCCYVLLVDEIEGCFSPADESFKLIELKTLKLPDERRLCFQYTAFELCNALKSRFLIYLRRLLPLQPIVYVDADMLFLNSMEELLGMVSEKSIALSVHCTTQPPYVIPAGFPKAFVTGLTPYLRSGFFNAGLLILGVTAEADQFLSWWSELNRTHCLNQPEKAYFVDQKFLDAVPSFFPNHAILRDPRLNVAWFNLHERSITRENETWLVNGKPMILFHATHLDWITAQSQNGLPVSFLEKLPAVSFLCSEYLKRLDEEGQLICQSWSYSYNYFSNGTLIRPEIRRAYWEEAMKKDCLDDPFTKGEWSRKQEQLVEREKKLLRLHQKKRTFSQRVKGRLIRLLQEKQASE